MTSSPATRPELIIMNQRVNNLLCCGNTRILTCPRNSGYGLRLGKLSVVVPADYEGPVCELFLRVQRWSGFT